MSVDGSVLHREKVVGRSLALIAAALVLFFGGVSIAYLSGWRPETPMLFKVITYLMVPLGLYVGLTLSLIATVIYLRDGVGQLRGR